MTDFDTPDRRDDDDARNLPDGYEYWSKEEMTERPGIFQSNWAYVAIFFGAMLFGLLASMAFGAEPTAYTFCDRRDNGDIVIHVPPGSNQAHIQKASEQCKRTLALLEALKMPTLNDTGVFPGLVTPQVDQ